MAKYKIDHDHENCIGCGACANICPNNWEMGSDGKSKPKKVDIEQNEYEENKSAADSCPVNVIHVTNTETNEKII